MRKTKVKIKKIEMTFYQNNTLAYYLLLLVVAGNLFTTVSVLNMLSATYKVAICIIFNIMLTLILFLCAIKIKVYVSKWNWFNFSLIVYLLLRNYLIYPWFYELDAKKTFYIRIINYLLVFFLLIASLITLRKVKNQALYRKLRQNL